MQKYINKVLNLIQKITKSSEKDASKILAGLTILAIAISWFTMGGMIGSNETEVSKEEIQEQQEIDKIMEEYERNN